MSNGTTDDGRQAPGEQSNSACASVVRTSPLRAWAVSSSHALATSAGAAILRAGGNAVDAAAAVQCTLGVVEPLASGLGGGAFWLIYWAGDGRVHALDARETAPAAATADIFLGQDGHPLDENERSASGLAVAVPGALMGLEHALARFGSVSLATVLQSAIDAANNGVPVSSFMASRMGLGSANNLARLRRSRIAARMYLPGGSPLREGDLLVQPDLASTLKTIAEQGTAPFYRGSLGKAIVDEVRARGGRMTLDDLTAYRPIWREPLKHAYGSDEIVTFGPPGSGVSLVQMLTMLRMLRDRHGAASAADEAHILLEVMRCVYADRRVTVGDPAHVHVPLEGLLDSRYLAERCRAFDPARAQERWEPGNPWQYEPTWTESSARPTPRVGLEGQGQTTHFTVADRWGNVVAATATIESLFGSGIMVPGLGLLLNNQMSDFNEYPSGPNQVRPGARPLSSMAPTMVMRGGKPILTLGSPGGATIVPSILQVLTRVVDDGQPLEDAVAAPRLYAGEGRRVTWEDGIDERLCTGLTERGHEISREPRSIGNVQAIMIDWSTGTLTAAADPRRQGAVVVDGEV